MAERRATNKYYPPDWDPSKGSINTYVGQHPLRDRARKLDQGILVVRFELPFNIWCEGCGNHVGMGVRYNAEKKKIGNYYSTPIFEFSMKCHLCSSKIVIHTDPKNTEYVIISGARKREEDYKPEDAGVIALQDEAEAEKLAADPFYKLEHDRGDEQKAEDARPVITQLREHNDKFWKDPYEASRMIRKRFRDEKKVREADQKVGDAIRDKHNLLLDIVPATAEDDAAAKRIKWVPEPDSVEVKKQRVQSTRIFSSPSSSSKLLTPATPTFRTPSLKHKILSSQRGRGDPFAVPSLSGVGSNRSAGRPSADLTSFVRPTVSVRSAERETTVDPEEFSSAASPHSPTGGRSAVVSSLVCADYGDSDDDE